MTSPEIAREQSRLGHGPRADVGIVADDADQLRLIEHILAGAGFSVALAEDPRRGLDFCHQARPKVVVCDSDLPGTTGIQFCKELRKQPELAGTYFLLMSADVRQDSLTEALDSGADDFLAKPVDHESLVVRVRVGLRIWTLHEQLRRAATRDSLTGLLNHDAFHRTLATEMSRARRFGRPLTLIMLDLDFFKAVNDTFGHPVGNATLESVAQLLRDSVRECDIIGRLGGEEFAILLPEASAPDALQAAERLRLSVRESLRIPDLRDHVLTVSVGVADSEDPRATSAAQLVDLADRALYLAKRRGRDQVVRACELEDGLDWTKELRTDEIEALRRRLAVLSARAKDVYVQSVASLLQALNEKDPFTARHALNVAFYAQQIAEQMGCTPGTVRSVYNAALLHDVGKVGVPDRILMKSTPLTRTERMVIDQVPSIGTRIVDHLRILEAEVQIIRHQHEYYDGSGQPLGLRGNQIPIGSRILLVADAFDAMTTDRIYRQRKPVDEVLGEIQRVSGRQFDPEVVEALQRVLDRNRRVWDQRIADTVRAMRLPGEVTLCATGDF